MANLMKHLSLLHAEEALSSHRLDPVKAVPASSGGSVVKVRRSRRIWLQHCGCQHTCRHKLYRGALKSRSMRMCCTYIMASVTEAYLSLSIKSCVLLEGSTTVLRVSSLSCIAFCECFAL